MEKNLWEFSPGESGVVLRVGGDGLMKRRLFDMGVTPGVPLTMRHAAPLGDPIEVTIRGYELALRRAEAEVVTMSVDDGKGGEVK